MTQLKRHLKRLSTIIILLATHQILTSLAQTADPVLYFSDITSGPKTGNSDASAGRTPNADGAIVTIWGRNFGSTRGTSRVSCNGADAASYYSWGDATKPANLSAYHQMQMISFQVSHLAQDGTGGISVTVNGRTSNALPFTVRAGNIFFVKTTGDDNSGNGSWVQPLKTIQRAVSSLANGDIAYVLDGVNAVLEGENTACINLDSDGTPSQPKALIVYPEATSRVGTDSIQRAFWNYDGVNNQITKYWVVSKFLIRASEVGIYTCDGFRVVGNWFTAPRGDGADGTVNVEGNDVTVIGNEFVNCGNLNCDKLYHTIYGKGVRRDEAPRAPTESNREIAWNYIHDGNSNRAINIYSEQAFAAYIQGHRVHDNVIVNQRGDGIMLGYYVVGDNWIYNNLIIRAGLGPEWADPSYHCGIRINTGHENVNKTDVYCYNNTLYACGFSGVAFPEETGAILISPEALTRSSNVRFSNNIIYSTGEPYLAGESTSLATGNHKNCWFGKGSAPTWDTGAINSDPLFVGAGANNFQLSKNSPCINTGLDVTSVVQKDLLGLARIKTAIDLGVYEFVQTTSIEDGPPVPLPTTYLLFQNYPNPFNPSTMVRYYVPRASDVSLTVFNVVGERVATLVEEWREAGSYQVQWSANVPSGVYFCRFKAERFVETKKMILVR